MSEINMVFELADQKEANQLAHLLQERIGRMEMVEEVEAVPETAEHARLTGLEIAAAIGVTVLIVRSSRELIEEVRKLVKEVKALMAETQGLKNAFVEVGAKRVPIDDLREDQLEQLAARA
jgi:hypothetical protein